MRKYGYLFALCCLVLSGFACDDQDRTPKTNAPAAKVSCQPAIYYGCSASCDPGVKAWQLCNDDGASYGACLCANPTPVSSPDASAPAPTPSPDAPVATPPASTPDAAASTPPSPDAPVITPPASAPDAATALPPPAPKSCQNGNDLVADSSMRPCGFVAGACRPGTQICNDGAWSACDGGTLPTPEVCDGVDNDCDGNIDDGLICQCDPEKGPTRPCGGHGNVGACKAGTQSCIAVGSGYEWAKSCQGEVLPKPETCNLVDDDCDGAVDNGFNTGAPCQGIGECGKGVIECNLQTNVAQCSTMPNGSNYHPVPELCDGKDNDCDGLVDEDFFIGAPCTSPGACFAFPGVYECSGLYAFTCSTGPKGSKSKATAEICSDLVDNNCDGVVNEGCDCKDGETQQCGPKNADGSVNQTGECRNVTVTCKNGKWPTTCPGAVYPSPELCDGKDNDCDGTADNGFDLGTTCQGIGECGTGKTECTVDHKGTICSTLKGGTQYHPMPELCDGKDNDCDGAVDEDFFVGAPCIGMGACAATPGIYECDGLQSFKCSTGARGSKSKATPEVCNDLIDNNCDGVVNEGCKCNDGEEQQCGPKNADGSVNQTGECRNVTVVCKNGVWPNTCPGAVYPTVEICDGLDNDCDGVKDNGFNIGTVCQGVGECGAGKLECASAKTTICSTMPGASQDKSKPEICDGKDNDCDGAVDEDYFVGAPCNGIGACGAGKLECASVSTTRCSTMPGASQDMSKPEVCSDLIDNDCNGIVNDGCDCLDKQEQQCGPKNADGSVNQTGECRNVTIVCTGGKWPTTCPKAVYPTAELCDGKDNDCDGVADNGFNIGTVCQGVGECGAGKLECASVSTTRCSTMPGASQDKSKPELCDGKDNDCDGFIDEDFFIGAPCIGLGVCGAGKLECASVSTTRCSTMPGASSDQSKPEVCDTAMQDENCNGSVNEGCACKPNDPNIVCGTSNVGECHYGSQSCQSNGTYATCVGAINPVPELCDGKDNDCDGTVDNGFNKQNDKNNCGACGNVCSFANASSLCQAGVCALGVCNANYFDFDKSAADGCETGCMPTRGGVEYCDGIDNNCDGIVDNTTVTVQSDPFNCGACGHVCALPNVAEDGCASGACVVVNCLPGYADTNGLAADGCETKLMPPDGGTGGSGGAGGTTGSGGTTGTGGGSGTGGNDAGVLPDAGSSLPPSIGTITCVPTGSGTMSVTMNGIVSLGLVSSLPAGSISSLALGMDWGTCWPANGNSVGCFPLTVDPSTVDTVAHTWTGIPLTRLTPRVTSSEWFDLKDWTIIGCYREGCGGSRPGELWMPSSETNGCIMNATKLLSP